MSDLRKELGAKSSDEVKWLELVIQQVGSLRYGVVEIVVHDSRVIQIEKTERVRLDKSEKRPEQT
jgi:hypothetical protein